MTSCADAAVPLAASIARPWTSSRRESEPFSKRLTRLEMIDSMTISFDLETGRQKLCRVGKIAWHGSKRGQRRCAILPTVGQRRRRCPPYKTDAVLILGHARAIG